MAKSPFRKAIRIKAGLGEEEMIVNRLVQAIEVGVVQDGVFYPFFELLRGEYIRFKVYADIDSVEVRGTMTGDLGSERGDGKPN
jgi:hypothetical protein